MTLKEKFDKVMEYPFSEYREQMKVLKEENNTKCEQIADEFAIEFAEWISYKYKYLDGKGWFATNYHLEMGIFKTSKELLEIFKKEKYG